MDLVHIIIVGFPHLFYIKGGESLYSCSFFHHHIDIVLEMCELESLVSFLCKHFSLYFVLLSSVLGFFLGFSLRRQGEPGFGRKPRETKVTLFGED